MERARPLPMNVGLFITTLVAFAMSTCEFLAPVAVLFLSGYVIGEVLWDSIPGRLLRMSVFGLAPSSFLLFIVFILQLRSTNQLNMFSQEISHWRKICFIITRATSTTTSC